MNHKMEEDLYLTIRKSTDEMVFKDRGSKFLGIAYPICSEKEVAEIIQHLKQKHPKARHWCYAWQLGTDHPSYRYNDDGEPNNSAGKPIYGQISSFGLTNVLIVVIRYFGGTKLGVGGLIVAYRSAAKLALQAAEVVEKMIMNEFTIRFEYIYMDKVMRIVKENNLTIIEQSMALDCFFKIAVRRKKQEQVLRSFQEQRSGFEIKKIN